MSLYSNRASNCTPILDATNVTFLTDREVLQKAHAAITPLDGLVHGVFKNSEGVCAIGALCGMYGQVNIHKDSIANTMQEYNDSMPRAWPRVRRARVLAWIEKKLTELPEGQDNFLH